MGSGSFPLTVCPDAEKLVQAARLAEEVAKEWRSAIYSGDAGGGQFDNAASDGAYLYRLRLASKLLRECIRAG